MPREPKYQQTKYQQTSGRYKESPRDLRRRNGLSRRGFITGLGAGTVGTVALTQAPALAGETRPRQPAADRFGRMFPDLPPFRDASDSLLEALREIGQPGGPLDTNDDLEAGARALATDPELMVNNPDNPNQTAGMTFLGQFIDHDITFDATSVLGRPTRPELTMNARTPALDLDSLYGGGPVVRPDLYQEDRARLRVESGGVFEDLPRGANGRAILGDPRNDENVMIAGLHSAMILFHNRVVDLLEADGVAEPQLFAQSRDLVRWHYQWIVVNEFLPHILGRALTQDILTNGRRWYRPERGRAFMPVEFQGAAYRFGHSVVRPSYRANQGATEDDGSFAGFIFDPAAEGQDDPDDMRGGFRAPRRFVGWEGFFDFGDEDPANNKLIKLGVSTPLFRLPLGAIPTGAPPISLPERTLLRHVTWEIPSGQQIAQEMGNPVITLSRLADFGHSLATQSPLWCYVLAEAEELAGGLILGPTGGRIVGEVVIGLLERDDNSYLNVEGSWQPTLPSANPGDFQMTDLLRFAQVDPDSRVAAGADRDLVP
jgi:Animal haem peroxidase